MKLFDLRNRGFTLVELMVVVAIIGILSAVALPNFKKYQAKSKTSEAKLQLAAIYTALSAFYSDYDTYASCLLAMGYDPRGEVAQRYYAMGIKATFGESMAVSNGAAACIVAATSESMFASGKSGNGVTSLTAVSAGAGTTGTFTAYAEGTILASATSDAWTITDSKVLTNVKVGY